MSEVKKKRFHILGLPHTITSKWWSTCAFTTKVFKLTEMLYDLGHEVIHYGCEGNEARCSEDVIVMSTEKVKNYPAFKVWKAEHVYYQDDDYHDEWMRNCAEELNKRCKAKDFILCPWGLGHKWALEPLSQHIKENAFFVESGIGYCQEWQWAPYRVYESDSYASFSAGFRDAKEWENSNVPRRMDAVIPNHYDPEDFTFEQEKDDYLLFFGRVLKTKGTHILAEMVKMDPTIKVKIAGQYKAFNDNIPEVLQDNPNVEFLGFVENDERARLLSKAKAVICASEYIEPFGGVNVEAQMCGTPVLASAWGAFKETIWHGKTGFVCRTVDQFMEAWNKVDTLNPTLIREWAVSNYSIQRAAQLYDNYFDMIYTQTGTLDLFYKHYPTLSLAPPIFIESGVPIRTVTVSNLDNDYEMRYLKHTCPSVEVLGKGKEFTFLSKIEWFNEYIQNIPDKEIVLFTDAFDVFYIDNPELIKLKFLKHDCDILWSTEKAYCHQLKEDQSFFDNKANVGDVNRAYRYMNTGTFIGKASALKLLFKDITNNLQNKEFVEELNKPCWGNEAITNNCTKGYTLQDKYVDQTVISHTLAKNGTEKYNFKFDYGCDIFYIPSVDWDEEGYYTVTPERRIHVTQTNSLPSIIHIPAKPLGREYLLDDLYHKTCGRGNVMAIMCFDGILDYAKPLVDNIRDIYNNEVDIVFFSFDGNKVAQKIIEGTQHRRNENPTKIGFSRQETRKFCQEQNIPLIVLDRQDFIPHDRELGYSDIITYLDISNKLYQAGYKNVFLLHPDIFIVKDFIPYFDEVKNGQWSAMSTFFNFSSASAAANEYLIEKEDALKLNSWELSKTAGRLGNAVFLFNPEYVYMLYDKYKDNEGLWEKFKPSFLSGDCAWVDYLEDEGFKHILFDKIVMDELTANLSETSEKVYFTLSGDELGEDVCWIHDAYTTSATEFLEQVNRKL